LRDPECYLGRVRESSPGSYLVVEKILMAGERLRENWPVDGTTGYDFANRVMGLFVDRAGERPLTDFYARFTGETTDYAALAREKKLQLMRGALGSDLSRLTALFLEVCERHRNHRDHTRHAVHEALLEVIASFTVYRTYVSAERSRITVDDVQALDKAIADARRIRPDLDAGLLDFLRDVLTLHVRGELETELVMRFQQVTGPVMAKAIEDTALYCFNRLTCLNEVGGDPSRFGVSPDEMFTETAESHAHWPRTMLALSTHDSKRSADVRARLCLLSEIPERWSDAVRRFAAVNDRHRRNGLPDRHAEYLLYQTLVGAWPIETARVTAYMIKAAREAKMRTSWTNPDEQYEEALRGFIQSALADESFVAHLTAFVAPLIEPGRVNSLAQTLIQLTAPGVPDLYQGSELWDLSLVDPDNRRPVDFALRRRLLGELKTAGVADVMRRSDEGLPKLWLITKTLALRKRNPALFAPDSSFVPLRADGARHDHVVAFARKGDAVTVVPRLVMKLGGGWQDTTLELPRGTWRNELTGAQHREGRFALGELLAEFPVALLVSQDGAR
jgi:(1->4)-alpha-D-glucan 1-alpha-D-glucosylmutase